ncbi:MAG: adenosine deaminase family protein, partial [Terriglobales bacterium]
TVAMLPALATAQPTASPEQRTGRHMESIRNRSAELLLFLRQLPKGGDLHNHLSGSVYAESYIRYAAEEGLCVDRKTSTLLEPPCDDNHGRPLARQAFEEQALYNQLVDAFSVRNFQPDDGETISEHFFQAFLKFDAATKNHRGEMLAEVVSRSASENVLYLELISPLDAMRGSALGARVGWDPDLAGLRQKLLEAGLPSMVQAARQELDAAEAGMRTRMRCGQPDADVGCSAVVRHIFEVHRAFPPEQVFAEMVFGFEMAKADPRVVSVNPVMAEAAYVSRRDFNLHMRMFDFLHGFYPGVRLTLHAGELAPELVPPEDLRDHIWKSIEAGHAQRIGHGIDALYERDAEGLMREMARRKILVEFCPTSYELLLSAPGVPHPLPLYLKHGVPVALATDDIGVARSDTTAEYMRAVRRFNLTYRDLKTMARNSLEYAFLNGSSLWSDAAKFVRASACAAGKPGAATVSPRCRQFLDASERARLQWRLEGDFARFESRF